MPYDDRIALLLGAVVLPMWLLAGVADYVCHARTSLARTSGVRESFLHLVQTAEIGGPLLLYLFLEPGGFVFVAMTLGVIAHTLTAWIDVRYTTGLRRITVAEQFAHAFLIVLPIVAFALLVVLHADALRAPDFVPRWRAPMLDVRVLAAILVSSVALGVVPGALEFANALRERRRPMPRSSS